MPATTKMKKEQKQLHTCNVFKLNSAIQSLRHGNVVFPLPICTSAPLKIGIKTHLQKMYGIKTSEGTAINIKGHETFSTHNTLISSSVFCHLFQFVISIKNTLLSNIMKTVHNDKTDTPSANTPCSSSADKCQK
jgi:hypothetical protein